jgi:hypothetical protein
MRALTEQEDVSRRPQVSNEGFSTSRALECADSHVGDEPHNNPQTREVWKQSITAKQFLAEYPKGQHQRNERNAQDDPVDN